MKHKNRLAIGDFLLLQVGFFYLFSGFLMLLLGFFVVHRFGNRNYWNIRTLFHFFENLRFKSHITDKNALCIRIFLNISAVDCFCIGAGFLSIFQQVVNRNTSLFQQNSDGFQYHALAVDGKVGDVFVLKICLELVNCFWMQHHFI